MKQILIEDVIRKVFENSLNTCEYLSGFINSKSTIKVKCKKHNNEFETKYENIKRNDRKHHICEICKKEDLNKNKKIFNCSFCLKDFFKKESTINKSKSGLFFCSRECKDNAQKIDSGKKFESIRPSHYSKDASINYRETALNNYNHECAICGFDEDIDILEVHHIDENRKNNILNNLIILCPTCHKKLTIKKFILDDNKSSLIKINQ